MLRLWRQYRDRGRIARAEAIAARGDLERALAPLRELSLEGYGKVLFGLPTTELPNLSKLLPAMPPEEVQIGFTGSAGEHSLHLVLQFLRRVAAGYRDVARRPLRDATILDYGCGYGRVLRMMPYFTAADRVYGFDPLEQAVGLCRDHNLFGTIEKCDFLPDALPCPGVEFDLVYSFSVFTHTSERATRTALQALRDRVKPGSVVVITIRPGGYWQQASGIHAVADAASYEARHEAEGFAFFPHPREPVDGDVTYGDTSMTIDWLRRAAPFFEVAKFDDQYADRNQQIVYLRPV